MFLALYLLHAAAAVNVLHDGQLWTKQDWASSRLDFPLREVNPTDDPETEPRIRSLVIQTEYNSLDGPRSRRVTPTFQG